jgi:serine protease AprX
MAIEIPRNIVERILLGPPENRRQLQDSPILIDVWIEFAKKPGEPVELLITPAKSTTAGNLAFVLDEGLGRSGAEVAPLEGVVAAKLTFEELLRLVLPITEWWYSEHVQAHIKAYDADRDDYDSTWAAAQGLNNAINYIIAIGKNERTSFDLPPAIHRLVALAGMILWARDQSAPPNSDSMLADGILAKAFGEKSGGEILEILEGILKNIRSGEARPTKPTKTSKPKKLVRLVALNRMAMPAVVRSIPTVKADAARMLFHVECRDIAWAVVDSGIQASHPAFVAPGDPKTSRVIEAYDFGNIRKIVSLDNRRILATPAPDDVAANKDRAERLKILLPGTLLARQTERQAVKRLLTLAEQVRNRRSVDWELIKPFVQIKTDTKPELSNHGTHVAGIIGAYVAPLQAAQRNSDDASGMCPDIQLYDFRVLGTNLKETEFAVIAALQFIRYLNERTDHMTIHGANLSLSIPHDVHNYGCGRTPVCMECERLVDSGVVVVAAAGNYGYQSFATRDGPYDGYALGSITDPGNADGVITVGSTHRTSPHTNGVSFFSSRGPTGDGRLKPDLVAPGERIRSTIGANEWEELDGTSMAAPHVSGAAAMLMARYSELIGNPRRIKQILCKSAIDLGRERSFQGHGMLDVLRAFQSI